MKTVKFALNIFLIVEVLLFVSGGLSYLLIGLINEWMSLDECVNIFGTLHLVIYIIIAIAFGLKCWIEKLFKN